MSVLSACSTCVSGLYWLNYVISRDSLSYSEMIHDYVAFKVFFMTIYFVCVCVKIVS